MPRVPAGSLAPSSTGCSLRKGFRVVERTFRHDGAARRGARGERQWGADILAIKADEDGTMHRLPLCALQAQSEVIQWRHEDGFFLTIRTRCRQAP